MNNVKQLVPPQQNNAQPLNIDLWNFHLFYKEMMPPALAHLLRSKLQEFNNNNGGRIRTKACDLIVSRQEKERKNFTKPKKSYGDIINILINELAEIKNKS